jgi:hypothetical protein
MLAHTSKSISEEAPGTSIDQGTKHNSGRGGTSEILSRNVVPVKTFHESVLPGVRFTHLLPFAFNPRGVLIHRVASIGMHRDTWNDRIRLRHTISYHCGGFAHGVELLSEPGEHQLVCEACEIRCKHKGLPSADELCGRHVHVGRAKAVRSCCQSGATP